jgi:hypothetical protein
MPLHQAHPNTPQAIFQSIENFDLMAFDVNFDDGGGDPQVIPTEHVDLGTPSDVPSLNNGIGRRFCECAVASAITQGCFHDFYFIGEGIDGDIAAQSFESCAARLAGYDLSSTKRRSHREYSKVCADVQEQIIWPKRTA